MKYITYLLFVISLLSTPVKAQLSEADKDYVNKNIWPATSLLYSQSDEGAMNMLCTATTIDQDALTYTVVSAAHCLCKDDSSKNIVTAEKSFFYISPDLTGNKVYLKAKVVGCGYRTKGDDFVLLTIDKTIVFPVVPLGKDPQIMDRIINVGGPLGLGKQIFAGLVSSPMLDRPVEADDIQWQGTILLQEFGVNGGSSGSSVICMDQKAICGFVVGSIGETNIIAMPVSRLIKFREQLAKGTYRWWHPDPDAVLLPEEKAKPKDIE